MFSGYSLYKLSLIITIIIGVGRMDAARAQDTVRIIRDFPAAYGGYLGSPFQMEEAQWPMWAAGITATGLLIYHDESVMRNIQGWMDTHPGMESAAAKTTLLGEGYITAAVCGLVYLGGYLSDESYLSNTGIVSAQSLVASAVTVTFLKSAFSRQRPYVNGQSKWFMYRDNYLGWPGSSTYMSFPSGHTIAAWSVASAIAHRYPKRVWIQCLCYGTASAVGLSRMMLNKHWAGDVLAGALIGFGAGRFFARRSTGKTFIFQRKRKRIPAEY